MNIYDKITYTRSGKRPTASEYIRSVFDSYTELHGDRRFGDDSALRGGVAFLGKRPVTVIGIEKGKTTNDKIGCNFGQLNPEGYRRALRLMKQAEKFHRPVVCLVDTAGAYCGIGAEERGQGQAIAENLFELSSLHTPIISIIIGEGGSGGALALALADRVWMTENSYYSVVSPEGCASILWKNAAEASRAAAALKPDAETLLSLSVIEKIIPEAQDFSRAEDKAEYFAAVRELLSSELDLLCSLDTDKLIADRYIKFRRIGCYDSDSD